jgi:2-methylcitrate dehydratase
MRVAIEADVTRMTYDFAGGGLYGVDKVIAAKEQADHSLPYLLAVALLDGDVMPAQFEPDRIARSDVQQLLKTVTVRPNQEFTDEYPARMPAKIVVRLQDGTTVQHEVQGFPGMPCDPFTWDDAVEKFDRLVAGRADDGVCRQIKDAVRSLETIQVADLMELLRRVKAPTPHDKGAVRPAPQKEQAR